MHLLQCISWTIVGYVFFELTSVIVDLAFVSVYTFELEATVIIRACVYYDI